MFEQSYSFGFEAAHELGANVPGDDQHPYARVHGHSFSVTVTLVAPNVGDQGWVADFAHVRAACQGIQDQLDHQFLNHIDGLEQPTLERLAHWIFAALKPQLDALAIVEVARPSLKEQVRYRP